MIELTICSNSLNAMKEAKRRKESKQNYQSLLSDLCKKGLNASYLTLEIGALGHHPPDFPKRLANFCSSLEETFVAIARMEVVCCGGRDLGPLSSFWEPKQVIRV